MSDLKHWFSAAELARFGIPEFSGSKQGILDIAKREGWDDPAFEGRRWRRREKRGGGIEYDVRMLSQAQQSFVYSALRAREPDAAPPSDMRAAMLRDMAWATYLKTPKRSRELAAQRLRVVRMVEDRCDRGWSKVIAIDSVAAEMRCAKSAIYRWLSLVAGVPDQDQLAHLTRHSEETGRPTAPCAEAAWEFFKGDYLRPEKPAAAACYRRLMRVAAKEGWKDIPSAKTLMRRINAMPQAIVVERRQGEKALKALYPAQRRDRTALHALEAVCADGHKLDIFVLWPDGTVGRPELVGFQDLYSGMILSWRIDVSENREMIRLAFGDIVEEFGVPEHAYLDNGRAFASKWITGGAKNRFRFKAQQHDPIGVMETMGVEAHFVTPYSGQSKPIERAWRDFAEDISRDPRLAGAYCGPNPQEKPANYGARAVALDDLLRVVEDLVVEHNNRTGRNTKICAGRLSFRQVFDESYARSLIRRASAAQRQLWLLMAEVLTVKKPDATLHLMGNRYHSPELAQWIGKKVTVRFDPQRLHQDLAVYTLDNRPICQAACIEDVGFTDTEAAQLHGRKRRAWMRAVRAASDAERGMSLSEVARLMDATRAGDTKLPPPRLVRLVRGNNAVVEGARDAAPDLDRESETDRLLVRANARLRVVREEEGWEG